MTAVTSVNDKQITVIRDEVTSAFVGFHAGLSRLNLYLEMLAFREKGKLENLEKNRQSWGKPTTTQPTYGTGLELNAGHIGERLALSLPSTLATLFETLYCLMGFHE